MAVQRLGAAHRAVLMKICITDDSAIVIPWED